MKRFFFCIGFVALLVSTAFAGQVEVYHNNKYVSKVNVTLDIIPGGQLLVNTSNTTEGHFKCIVILKDGDGTVLYESQYIINNNFIYSFNFPHSLTTNLAVAILAPGETTMGKLMISSSTNNLAESSAAFIMEFDKYGNVKSTK